MAKINLGRVVDVPKNFELIESVTLESDTASFVRTLEPDGTPYAFRGMMVVADFAATTTLTGNIPVYYDFRNDNGGNSSIRSYFINPRDTVKVKRGFSELWIDHGYWMSGWWACTSEEGAFGYRYDNPYSLGRMYAGATGVLYRVEISSISAGSTIRLYAVRQ